MKLIPAFLFAAIAPITGMAQNALTPMQLENSIRCHASRPRPRSAAKTTVADLAEENYDMKYVKLNLNMSNTSDYISGDVTTSAVVTAASIPAYIFELNALTIDSVLINGTAMAVTTAGVVRTVTLPVALAQNTSFTAQVFYHGSPTSGTLQQTLGVNTLVSPSWGAHVTFTLSESYHANEWWPCKQSLHDKIDSADIWITVDDSLKAGSNGMVHVTALPGNKARYEWHESYPIDYYLVSAAVGPYIDYSYYMHFTGSTDSMLVQNYVYNNPGTLPNFQSVIDSTGMMIDYFSQLYGRYPFWHEKYGHSMGPLSGGMEHETMTTLGFFEGTLVAHELGHQWFGDNATCGTWADIVMNEGFAGYTETLFIDHFRSHTQALQDMQARHSDVKSQPDGSVYVDDTTNENRIFDSRLSYDKGASVLHMLRFLFNNDSLFFAVYRNYQQQFAGSTGTAEDFKNVAAATLGQNLDTFFNQWIYLQGYPIYDVSWSQAGNVVSVTLNQTTSDAASCPLFVTPMEIQLQSTAGDTTVRVYNNLASQTYTFTWPNITANNIAIDPNYWLLYKLNSLTHIPSLVSHIPFPTGLTIYPNPAKDSWQVNGLTGSSTLQLTDMSGRVLWNTTVSQENISIPANNISAGIYLLNATSEGSSVQVYKLVKE